MMKIIELIKIIFISFEAAFVLALILAFQYFPDAFQNVGHQFKTNSDVWKFIPTVPLIICGFSIQYAWKILNPISRSSNRILHEWPGYWKLKIRVIASIFISTEPQRRSIKYGILFLKTLIITGSPLAQPLSSWET